MFAGNTGMRGWVGRLGMLKWRLKVEEGRVKVWADGRAERKWGR